MPTGGLTEEAGKTQGRPREDQTDGYGRVPLKGKTELGSACSEEVANEVPTDIRLTGRRVPFR